MKFFVDTADMAEIKSTRRQRPARRGHHQPVADRQIGPQDSGRDRRDLRHRPRPGQRRGRRHRLRRHDARGRGAARASPAMSTVKVPLTPDGLRACQALRDDGAMVNVTLCFSAAQALLAAKAGATLRLALRRPAGRYRRGRHGPDRRHPARSTATTRRSRPRCWWPRSATRSMWSQRPSWAPHVATMPPAVLRQLFNASADRQGPGRLPGRLGEDRPDRSPETHQP